MKPPLSYRLGTWCRTLAFFTGLSVPFIAVLLESVCR
jgi:hypothetical protein